MRNAAPAQFANGKKRPRFPARNRLLWKAWKPCPLWRSGMRGCLSWRGSGRSLHKTARGFTGGSRRAVESVGIEGRQSLGCRAFSSSADFPGHVLENQAGWQSDGPQIVGRVIHFSARTTGTTRLIYRFLLKTVESRRAVLSRSNRVSRIPVAAPVLTLREHGTRNPDIARVFHAGVYGKGEYNQDQAGN